MKPQDCVVLIKLLANPKHLELSQNELAVHLCMSVSEVNAGIKRLLKAGLLRRDHANDSSKINYKPIATATIEFFIHGLKYAYPANYGELTRGIPTSYAAPILKKHFVIGDEAIPVWPHAEGNAKGFALSPLYRSVPNSLIKYPDDDFYDLLALIDAIRHGKARERNMAIKLLEKKLKGL